MMRGLAEHEPGKIQFDELAARATFRKFLSLPAFGKVWLLCEGNAGFGYIILTMASVSNFTATTHSSTNCMLTPRTAAADMAFRQFRLSKRKHARRVRMPSIWKLTGKTSPRLNCIVERNMRITTDF